jgi:hypothetical protein
MGAQIITSFTESASTADKRPKRSPRPLERVGADRAVTESLLAQQVLDRLRSPCTAQPIHSPSSKGPNRNAELEIQREHPTMHTPAVQSVPEAQGAHGAFDEFLG